MNLDQLMEAGSSDIVEEGCRKLVGEPGLGQVRFEADEERQRVNASSRV